LRDDWFRVVVNASTNKISRWRRCGSTKLQYDHAAAHLRWSGAGRMNGRSSGGAPGNKAAAEGPVFFAAEV
jgi:hypothetical protein